MLGIAAVAMLFHPTAFSADGIAVSAAYRWGSKNFAPLIPEADDGAMKGRICRFTIKNSHVVKCDTLFYGMGQYPAISWDGTRVAFFRYGIFRNTKGNTLEGLQNPVTTRIGVGQTGTDTLYGSWSDAWVSIIEANGSIRNLVKLPVRPGEENGLDWPVGDWIYYACPNSSLSRQGSDVRRVNTITGQDERIAGFGGLYMRRFTMTLDAAKLASQTMGNGGSNTVFNLPSLSHALDCPACNISISPSGNIVGHYLGGRHVEVWFANDPISRRPSLYDAANWNPDMCFTTRDVDTVIGCEVIRWAVNSDTWFTQSVGWHGHAGNLIGGGNSVLMNWIGHEALCVSENPRIYGEVVRYGNCAGDFFLTDIPIGKMEDTAGVLRTMPNLPLRAAADTVRITADSGGANPASQVMALTFAQGATVAALSATSSVPWLSAAVEGSGTGQSVRVTADIAGLSLGNYSGQVIVSGGTLRAQFCVILRVNGTPRPAAIVLTYDTLYAQTNGTVQFAAALRDQFGQAIAGTVTWSVAAGGAISASGLFTSSGAIGTFGVTAQSGPVSKQGAVVVTANKPLPLEGNCKELLCLETSDNLPYLAVSDSAAIQAMYSGPARKIPVDGQQVIIGANTYTWRLRTDADGVWADGASKAGFVAYWYTTLISQSSRTVEIACRHNNEFTAWLDGSFCTYRPYYAAKFDDWNAQFVPKSGGSGLFFKLWQEYCCGWGGNMMSIRFINPQTGRNIGGVQYAPPGTVATAEQWAPRAKSRPTDAVTILANHVRIRQSAEDPWRVSIVSSNGAVVKSFAGRGGRQTTISVPRLATGVYVIRLVTNGKCTVRRMMVR